MTATSVGVDSEEIVLIVDDDEALRQSLADVLALEGVRTVAAERSDRALELFSVHEPTAVVIDYHLPDSSGMELAHAIKERNAETPVLLLTGFANIETATAAVGKLDAYLLKPVDPQLFLQTVQGVLARRRLAAENRRLLDRLQRVNAYQALYDHLTGLPNRALLDERLEKALEGCHKSGDAMAVLFIDLDDFKVVNDLFGHHVGDHLLREMARRLADSCYRSETVARFGGDEFVVVVPKVKTPADASIIASRLIDRVAERLIIEGVEHHITASIGIALAGSDGQPSPEAMLRNADTAMYRAKEAGRNRWELFDDDMRVRVTERFEIERGLRHALNSGGLEIDYQPILDLQTSSLVGAEALIRWQRPGHGRMLPDSFLGVAEESNLIVPLGMWVLEAVLRDMASWQSDGLVPANFRLWVNVAPQQLTDPSFALVVGERLARYGISPHLLGLEILEEAMLDMAAAESVLTSLRQMAVSLNLDDFGAGHSNLSLLQALPITGLKIDRRFVAALDAEDDGRGSAIVAGLISLAHSLQLTVVAEGVETATQATTVRAMGCELAQGYFYGRPGPPEQLWDLRQPVST